MRGLSESRDTIESVLVTENGVQDDGRDGLPGEERAGLAAGRDGVDDVLWGECGLQRLANGGVVVNHEDVKAFSGSPCHGALRASPQMSTRPLAQCQAPRTHVLRVSRCPQGSGPSKRMAAPL